MSRAAAYRSYAVELPGRATEPAGTSYDTEGTAGTGSAVRRPMAGGRQEKRRQRGSVENLSVFTEEGSFFFSQACRAFTPATASGPLPDGTPSKPKGSRQPPRYLRPGKLRHLLNSSSAVRASSASLRWPNEAPGTQDAGAVVVVQEARSQGPSGAQRPRAPSSSSSLAQAEGPGRPAAASEAISGALVTIEESGAERSQHQAHDGVGSPAYAVGGEHRHSAPGGSPGPQAAQPGSVPRPNQGQQLQAGHYSASPLYNPPPVNKRQRKHYALCSPFHPASTASALSPLGHALLPRPSPLVLRSPALGLITPPPSSVLSQMVLVRPTQDSAASASLDGLPFDVLIRIICFLQHDELAALLLTSKTLRQVVETARFLHFDFTTPQTWRCHACGGGRLPEPSECLGQNPLLSPFCREAAASSIAGRKSLPWPAGVCKCARARARRAGGPRLLGWTPSLDAPAAPRQAPRPPEESRRVAAEVRRIAAPLFPPAAPKE